ncbi:MAG: hypothetical protein AB7Q01_16005 [Gammaproteobacteria bacterium]
MTAHGEKKHKEQVHIPALTDPRWDGLPRWLVGIDDTDNLESRGTGFRARQLALQLQQTGKARLACVTRHQLLVSPEIPYTSHNSSACLALDFAPADLDEVREFCRQYLLRESAPGSDAGLCIAAAAHVSDAITAWGRRAQREVLTIADSHALAERERVYLEGLTGTRQGVIGALSAIGLHRSRDDGRFLWMRGVRDLSPGTYSVGNLKSRTDIERFETLAGQEVLAEDALVCITEWARPVFRRGHAVLLVEPEIPESQSHAQSVVEPSRWRVAAKDVIKRF